MKTFKILLAVIAIIALLYGLGQMTKWADQPLPPVKIGGAQ